MRILRELQQLSQSQLSGLTGIPQSTISAVENDRVNLGFERAKTFLRGPSSAIPPSSCFPAGKFRSSGPHKAKVERTGPLPAAQPGCSH